MSAQSPTDMTPALQDAMAMLGSDPAAAREKARAGLAANDPDPRFWVVAGHASRALEDWADLEIVADGLLRAAPSAILGLIWKADCLSKRGEQQKASVHYEAALQAANDAGAPLPEATQRDLQRVEREIEEIRRTYAWHLDKHLRDKGITPESCSSSFREAFAILAGTHDVQIGLQRPTMLLFPGLPERSFYDPTEFGWTADLEAATETIAAEFAGIRADPRSLEVLGERPGEDSVSSGVAQDDTADLRAYALWADGAPDRDHLSRCPVTADLLERLPRVEFPNRTPMAAFWRFAPQTRILPRNGMLNSRLICHLPLIVSDSCGLAVNGERRVWETGKLVIFDDSIEHEIWNEGNGEAVVLLFDIARPEIGDADQAALAALFEAADSFR